MTMVHFYMVLGNNREHERTVYHVWSMSVASVCVCVRLDVNFSFLTFIKTHRVMIVCHCCQKCGG